MNDDMWGTGNFHAVSEKIADAGETLVEAAGIEPGMDVLDVGCGSGNATIPAAKRAARVTGVDASPGLIEVAREKGADAMVEVDWVVGDAQALPFEDDSFDRVISIFGHMFAPDHRAAANELKRVCRPGGRIAIACWSPDGTIGKMFQRMSQFSPPPPDGAQPPVLWGTEEHVRELLGQGVEFARHDVVWTDESAEAYADFMERSFPPLVAARARAGHDVVHEAYLEFLKQVDEGAGDEFRFRGEYLLSTVQL